MQPEKVGSADCRGVANAVKTRVRSILSRASDLPKSGVFGQPAFEVGNALKSKHRDAEIVGVFG
ncbi:MAG: hypothetical protein ACI8UO_003693 [Verrucomicrobiales bacterium]|jgi:hypothetical protein